MKIEAGNKIPASFFWALFTWLLNIRNIIISFHEAGMLGREMEQAIFDASWRAERNETLLVI